jgi:hypothetical protein
MSIYNSKNVRNIIKNEYKHGIIGHKYRIYVINNFPVSPNSGDSSVQSLKLLPIFQ